MSETPNKLTDVLFDPPALWRLLKEYFNFSRLKRTQPVVDQESLKEFINTRASYVAQISLYGYLRTRAGTRYPELFDDDYFVTSINIAKWQCWLACVSDLAVFAGGLLVKHSQASTQQISELIKNVVNEILEETGQPEDAGDKFLEGVNHVRQRLELTEWQNVTDDEQPFSHSPQALLEWAPVVDEFKQLDEEIVLNSVRFRWQKVRQDLRKTLHAESVINSYIPS